MRRTIFAVAAFLMLATPVAAQVSLYPVIVDVRSQYPERMTMEQVGQFVYEVARQGGPEWGVLLKERGNRCMSPVGEISCDIIVHVPTQQEFDIAENADGEPGKPQAGPSWQRLDFKCGQPPSGCRMDRVRVVATIPTPVPPAPPIPVPNPEPDEPSQLMAMLLRIIQNQEEQIRLLTQQVSIIDTRLAELVASIRGGVRIRW